MRVIIVIICFTFLFSTIPASSAPSNDESWRTYQNPKAYPPGSPFDMNDGLPYSLTYYLDWVRQLGHSNLIIGERPSGDRPVAESRIRGKRSSKDDWLLTDGTDGVWICGIPAPESTSAVLLAVRPATGEIETLTGIALLCRVPPRASTFEAHVGDILHFGLGGSKSSSASAEVAGDAASVLFNDGMSSLIISCDQPGTVAVQISEHWWNDPTPRRIQTCELRILDSKSENRK